METENCDGMLGDTHASHIFNEHSEWSTKLHNDESNERIIFYLHLPTERGIHPNVTSIRIYCLETYSMNVKDYHRRKILHSQSSRRMIILHEIWRLFSSSLQGFFSLRFDVIECAWIWNFHKFIYFANEYACTLM